MKVETRDIEDDEAADFFVYLNVKEYRKALSKKGQEHAKYYRNNLFSVLDYYEPYLCVTLGSPGDPQKRSHLAQLIRQASFQATNGFKSGMSTIAILNHIKESMMGANESLPEIVIRWVVEKVALFQERVY